MRRVDGTALGQPGPRELLVNGEANLPDSARALIPTVNYSPTIPFDGEPALSTEEAIITYANQLDINKKEPNRLPQHMGSLVLEPGQISDFKRVAPRFRDRSYGTYKPWSALQYLSMWVRNENIDDQLAALEEVARFSGFSYTESERAGCTISPTFTSFNVQVTDQEQIREIAKGLMDRPIITGINGAVPVYFEPVNLDVVDKIMSKMPGFMRWTEPTHREDSDIEDYSEVYRSGLGLMLSGDDAPTPEQVAHIMARCRGTDGKPFPLAVRGNFKAFSHQAESGRFEYGLVNLGLAGGVATRFPDTSEEFLTEILSEQNPESMRFYRGGALWKDDLLISTEALRKGNPYSISSPSFDTPFEGWDQLQVAA